MELLFGFILSFLFALAGFYIAKTLHISPTPRLIIIFALLILAAGYIGVSTQLFSVFGFNYFLNNLLQSLGIGLLTGLLTKKEQIHK
jgi:hypothetical protein